MLRKTLILLSGCMAFLAGCGNVNSETASLFGMQADPDAKTPCPNPTSGFYVCLDAASTFVDASFEQTIATAMATAISLVNGANFQNAIKSGLSGGDQVVDTLLQTNYIVLVEGYCDSGSTTLAQATVGGYTVHYNECTVQTDSQGNADIAQISGVMLHEISHNLGYTHADVNPSPDSVPYYLGDTAQAMLETSSTANTKTSSMASGVDSAASPTTSDSTLVSGNSFRSGLNPHYRAPVRSSLNRPF